MPRQGRPAIVASVLPADFARLGDAVQKLEKGGVGRIHWDVMDGQVVPNLTFGPDVIAANRDLVAVGSEAHLMVVHPEPMLPRWVEADGGIGTATIRGAAGAGADVFCVGSSLSTGPGTVADRVTALRAAAVEAIGAAT